MTKHDVLWYFVGGINGGKWMPVHCTVESIAEHEASVRRMGYVTRRGKLSIGAPEGVPAELEAHLKSLRIGSK